MLKSDVAFMTILVAWLLWLALRGKLKDFFEVARPQFNSRVTNQEKSSNIVQRFFGGRN